MAKLKKPVEIINPWETYLQKEFEKVLKKYGPANVLEYIDSTFMQSITYYSSYQPFPIYHNQQGNKEDVFKEYCEHVETLKQTLKFLAYRTDKHLNDLFLYEFPNQHNSVAPDLMSVIQVLISGLLTTIPYEEEYLKINCFLDLHKVLSNLNYHKYEQSTAI